jgi:hypothetical protein
LDPGVHQVGSTSESECTQDSLIVCKFHFLLLHLIINGITLKRRRPYSSIVSVLHI